MGITAVDGHDLRETIAADRLLQKPPRGLCVPGLREEKVNGLAVFIHRPIQRAQLARDLNGRLVHPPADPHVTLAPMKRLFELWTIFDDPPIHGGVIHLHSPFLHEFFNMARAQRVRHIPADAHEHDVWWEMSPFEAYGHRRSPSRCTLRHSRRAYLKSPPGKTCDRTNHLTSSARSLIWR